MPRRKKRPCKRCGVDTNKPIPPFNCPQVYELKEGNFCIECGPKILRETKR